MLPRFNEVNSKEACYDFAIDCCSAGLSYTDNVYVFDTVAIIKTDKNDVKAIDKRYADIASIRKLEGENVKRREAAHIVLHTIEIANSGSPQGAAGHAARVAEALSRINEGITEKLMLEHSI